MNMTFIQRACRKFGSAGPHTPPFPSTRSFCEQIMNEIKVLREQGGVHLKEEERNKKMGCSMGGRGGEKGEGRKNWKKASTLKAIVEKF